MKVKIDTKGYFRIFRVKNTVLHANMAENLSGCLLECIDEPPRNAIVVLEEVKNMDGEIAEALRRVQVVYKDKHLSFVVTGSGEIKRKMEDAGISYTPTLQEAVDLVMMEQLEREFLDAEKENENENEKE